MPAQRRWCMNPGSSSCHVDANSESSLLQQSGTEGYQATVRHSSKQNHAQTRIAVSNNDTNARFAHTEASSSRIRLSTAVAGKDDNEAGGPPHSELMSKNLQTKTRSCPQPPGQSNIGSTLSRVNDGTTKKTTKNGDKRKRKSMDRMAGFDGGPSTAPARPTRRRVQRETGAVPVAVPGKGTRPSPVQSTSIEVGKSKETGQANQASRSSSLVIIERDRPALHWDKPHPKKKPVKRNARNAVNNIRKTDIIDVDKAALDVERQKKAAALKNITFSKKKVKEEVREEEDVLRAGVGDGRGSGGGGESREPTAGEVNGQVGGETLEREHAPWTCDEQGNIPGLSATSRSARVHGRYNLPQAAGVVNVETRAIPIPLPSLFPEPPDSVSDISDEDLYSPKVAAPQVQVKEEQREDFFFFDSLIPDLQTLPTASGLEQNATYMPNNSASYPLDIECITHPKNKRKQLSHAKNAPSPKKVKTGVCAFNVGEGQSESKRESVCVQDEDGGEVPHASVPAVKKKAGRPKKKKGKEKKKDVVIDTHVVTIGRAEDEMEICAVETKQGEIPTGDAPSGAVSTIGETTGRKESENTGENAESAEQDERVKAGTDISVTVTPSTGSLPASASVHDATRVESNKEAVCVQDEDGGEVLRASMPAVQKKADRPKKKKKGKEKKKDVVIDQVETHVVRAEDEMEICSVETKQGEIPTGDAPSGAVSTIGETTGRKGSENNGENTESAEQDERVKAGIVTPSTGPLPASASVHDDATRVEPSAPDSVIIKSSRKGKKKVRATENGAGSTDKVPKRKRNVRGQTGEQTQNHDVDPVGGNDETSRKVKDQATEGIGCQGPEGAAPAGDGEEPHSDETPRERTEMNDQTTEGGERAEGGPAGDEPIFQQEETARKMNDRTTEAGERAEGGPAGDEPIFQQEETARKMNDQTTEGGESIQGSSVDLTAANDIAGPDGTPKKKRKATDQSATKGIPRRGRPPKEKKNDEDINGETSLVKLTEGNGSVEEMKEKTPRGRKKRATMDEKDDVTDGVVRKKIKRVKLALEEGGDGNRQSGKTVKSMVKWMLVCKNRTATGKKASRQGKGKEKAQSTGMAPDVENEFKEEAGDNVKTRKTLRPSIWASSKTELLLVLPELSGSKCFNGITEGSSNFPMVMLDESTAEGIGVDVRWFDDKESESSGETPSVRLTLARDFVCPVPERASTGGMLMDSVAYTASSDAGPSSDVMTQPSVPSSAAPGASSVINAYGNGCGPLPMVLPHDDNDGMDLEYIDEDAPQGGAVSTLSVPSVTMSPVFLTPIVPYAPPVAREATTLAHISHQVQRSLQAPAPPTYHPAIQFSPYNPTTLSTPSTVSIPSLLQHLLPFQQDQIPFPTAPVPIPIPSKIPLYDEKPSPPTTSELKSELDTITPPSPPPEIEILTSSSRLSLPLILISSHETFKRHFWGPLTLPPHSNGPGDSPERAEKVGLAAEHAYVFLGFFRVVRMDERRVILSDEERVNLTPGKVAGRVEWTFDVEWDPGYHGSRGSEELSHPWWAPDFIFGRPVGRGRGSKKGFTWLEKHAQARLNLLPMQLVDGQEAGSSDEAMPKGWLCKACGKLNQKVMMRHRWCGSRMCRDNPLSRGYAVDLSSARDANQTPLALPINMCNRRTVDASVADWDDGMRTLKYRPMSIPDRLGNVGERGGILQHVFTCNLVDLQTEATSLFESIQSEVCLMKSTGESGPFFKSHVSDSHANKRDKYAFSCLSWSEAPQAVREAQELMSFMGKKYGEEETLDIDKLTIVGWVSSGTRKTPTVLAAREHAIAMLCLGNDVVLTIVPKWEVSAPVPWSLQVQQSSSLSYPRVPPFEHPSHAHYANATGAYPYGMSNMMQYGARMDYIPAVHQPVPYASQADPSRSFPFWQPQPYVYNPQDAEMVTLPPSMPVLPRVANFTPPKIQSTLARTPVAIKPPSADQMELVDVAAAPATENHVRHMGALSENSPSGVVPAQITSRNSRSKPASKLKPKPKQTSESMSVTLVHGDMLLFSGCDFEYSVKRMGTSILVIGSKEDSTASI